MRDLFRYIWAVAMNWLQGYWFLTAIPETVKLFSPCRFDRLVLLVDQYVPAQIQYAFILALGLFGLFFASFRAWRELDREIGLRAHIRSINYTNDGGYETKVFVAVNITNSGVIPSVATDWTLVFGKRSVRSYERKFRTDTNVDFDPQMTPIGLGNRAYGTLAGCGKTRSFALSRI